MGPLFLVVGVFDELEVKTGVQCPIPWGFPGRVAKVVEGWSASPVSLSRLLNTLI